MWVVIHSAKRGVLACADEADARAQAQAMNEKYMDEHMGERAIGTELWPPARAVEWTPGCCVLFGPWTGFM